MMRSRVLFPAPFKTQHADLGAVVKTERDIADDRLIAGREDPADPHHREDDLLIVQIDRLFQGSLCTLPPDLSG